MISYISDQETGGDPIMIEAKNRLEENYRILKNAVDQDGRYFQIIPMPFAPIVIRPFYSTPEPDDYRTEVTSYMNFLITNHTILVPSYRNIDTTLVTRKKEEFIEKTFRQYYPDKKVIFIDTGDLNSRGGGIHCLTASKPRVLNTPPKNPRIFARKRGKV